MKKQIKAHEERNVKSAAPNEPSSTPLPQYLLDRSQATNAKALSSAIKNKRAEKAAKFSVPLPRVRGIAEEEMFKVIKTGKKTAKKGWKRMITKPTFGTYLLSSVKYVGIWDAVAKIYDLVGNDFTRRPVKYERFIRPMGLRYKKANVTHPELGVTVQLPIISVKKNPQNPMYTQLGVLTKGTIVEVNVSELGLVTAGGKVVWGRWAQITNNCENDGCVNAYVVFCHLLYGVVVMLTQRTECFWYDYGERVDINCICRRWKDLGFRSQDEVLVKILKRIPHSTFGRKSWKLFCKRS